ncbi:UvrD-helicase domain-containing protein [Basilea psittacipulmonis]|uniref:DNA 3'-5' helicase II n=1 Tax=Basilea psittacipulmonis DSM 24701 TaxID=1072685 RepID=A0A077DCP1_9BURK|nr:UvrD-helicase domain-containing protein [Basilea psittacipulmonis]AIL31951.1 hypothetical protein IX83_00175 [Basilea psittacipulmonis DSM 24701]
MRVNRSSELQVDTLLKDNLLVEACAGAGKTSYIVDLAIYEAKYEPAEDAKSLILTFTRSAREVAKQYIKDRDAEHFLLDADLLSSSAKIKVMTLDEMAYSLLSFWGDDYQLLDLETVIEQILPDVIDEYAQVFKEEHIDLPLLTRENLYLIFEDISLYRHSKSYQLDSADVYQTFHFSLPFVETIFACYEQYRSHWTNGQGPKGVFGFRTVQELCYDLLVMSEYEHTMPQAWRYAHIMIDEFHDVTPLYLDVVTLVANLMANDRGRSCQLVAVGDRFQSLNIWRTQDSTSVFELYKNAYNPEVVYLDKSYRYGKAIAKRVQKITNDQRGTHLNSLEDRSEVRFEVTSADKQLPTTLIVQHRSDLVSAAFYMLSFLSRVSFNFHEIFAVRLINQFYIQVFGTSAFDGKIYQTLGDWQEMMRRDESEKKDELIRSHDVYVSDVAVVAGRGEASTVGQFCEDSVDVNGWDNKIGIEPSDVVDRGEDGGKRLGEESDYPSCVTDEAPQHHDMMHTQRSGDEQDSSVYEAAYTDDNVQHSYEHNKREVIRSNDNEWTTWENRSTSAKNQLNEHFLRMMREAVLVWMSPDETPILTIMDDFEQKTDWLSFVSIGEQNSWNALKHYIQSTEPNLTYREWPNFHQRLITRNGRSKWKLDTVLNAKGKEFNRVVVYDVNKEGDDFAHHSLVSQNECYVAMTRAKQTLILLSLG